MTIKYIYYMYYVESIYIHIIARTMVTTIDITNRRSKGSCNLIKVIPLAYHLDAWLVLCLVSRISCNPPHLRPSPLLLPF